MTRFLLSMMNRKGFLSTLKIGGQDLMTINGLFHGGLILELNTPSGDG